MHFLVVGCGSIGRRHIRNLQFCGHKVSGCEKDLPRARKLENDHGIEVFRNLNVALKREYDGVFICVPTSLHMLFVIKVAKKGLPFFVEKPISDNLSKMTELERIAREKDLAVLVGCNLRFSKGFKFLKKAIDENRIGKVLSVKIECGFYLPYWHPYEDYRKAYSANKHLGGGVIFDDIHEIDSLHSLFGPVKEVFCFAEKVSSLEIDTEDVAEIFLKFRSGPVAQIHLDYLQRTYRRYYEIIGEEGVIYWDVLKERIELYSGKPGQCKVLDKTIKAGHERMFIDEVKHFANCIKKKEPSVNDISFAKETLKIALACHASARKKEMVRL